MLSFANAAKRGVLQAQRCSSNSLCSHAVAQNFAASVRPMLERTTLQLFRDCLRTAHHIGGDSAKGRALKQVVKEGFRKHIGVTDAAEIEKLKADAVRALSNYLVMKSLNKSKK